MKNTQELIFFWETCTRWLEFHEKHISSASQDGGDPSFWGNSLGKHRG